MSHDMQQDVLPVDAVAATPTGTQQVSHNPQVPGDGTPDDTPTKGKKTTPSGTRPRVTIDRSKGKSSGTTQTGPHTTQSEGQKPPDSPAAIGGVSIPMSVDITQVIANALVFGSEADAAKVVKAIGLAKAGFGDVDPVAQGKAIEACAGALGVPRVEVLVKLAGLKSLGMLDMMVKSNKKLKAADVELALSSNDTTARVAEALHSAFGGQGFSVSVAIGPDDKGQLAFSQGRTRSAKSSGTGTGTYVPAKDMFPNPFLVKAIYADGKEIWAQGQRISTLGTKHVRHGFDTSKTAIDSGSNAALACMLHYYNHPGVSAPAGGIFPQASLAFWTIGSGDAKRANEVSPKRFAHPDYQGQGQTVRISYVVEIA